MITDDLLRVSVDQDISQTVETYVSTSSIDLGAQPRDMGMGMAIHATFSLTAAVTSAGAATIQFQIITSAAAALTSPVVMATTPAIALAQLALGAQFFLDVNPDVDDRAAGVLRFLGAQYVIAGATTTAGTVTTDFVLDRQDGRRFHNSGFTVES